MDIYNMAASSTLMSQMASSIRGANLGGLRLQEKPNSSSRRSSRYANSNFKVRCDGGVSGLKETIDKATKKTITKDQILWNQEHNESEKRSVFGAEPIPGALYPRPEVKRRPETGNRGFVSVFSFDGAAPETINGRLAMLGMVWAFVVEKATGLTVFEQLYMPGATGLVYFVGAVQLFTYASLVPIADGESTDARSFGPFTAQVERWNGRLAMIGFFSLVVTELFRHAPVFH